MRLFIAINLNDNTRLRLLGLRDEISSRSKCGNFSLTENLHLTLAFLGECDADQTAAAKTAMRMAGVGYYESVESTGYIGSIETAKPVKPVKPGKSSESSESFESSESSESFKPFEPFELTIERIGRFKRDNRDIWWAGVRPNKPLTELQKKLMNNLTEAGFKLDNRKYSPHITLGREVVTDAEPWQFSPFGEIVTAVDLMKSERIKGKLTYTSIFRIGTGDGVTE